ncbi:phosphate signaling complex PhoU family protein [Amycolatopsis saalfeldensis]|uniref:Phosphate transport system protein n=1 Tax=Amycolatopsis saalfeldensis TaxID=394193 RepID=A0A1H8YMA8_9PSEU|nr:PhoU domain-containing protein [Amycolatopsis saalfeldensis]SEP53315.1 phosphate transport system protein [Amycolatopsis saalfeldensis]
MREAFHGELAQLGEQLDAMCGLAAEAMRRATQALLDTDLALAERVVADDDELDRHRGACEDHAQKLLALQAPVAGDLRTILAALYCAEIIERMGDLAAHIAATVRFNHPEPAIPPSLRDLFATLGQRAGDMAIHLRGLISGFSPDGFAEMDRLDDAVDALHAEVMATVTGTDWSDGVRTATNVALLARFYERFADQAVSAARRLDFATTGTLPN